MFKLEFECIGLFRIQFHITFITDNEYGVHLLPPFYSSSQGGSAWFYIVFSCIVLLWFIAVITNILLSYGFDMGFLITVMMTVADHCEWWLSMLR